MLFFIDMPAPGAGYGEVSLLAGVLLATAIVAAGLWIVCKRRRALSLLLVLPLSAVFVFADMPSPPPSGQRVDMRIKLDYRAEGGPVLVIPAKLLPKLHAGFASDDLSGGRLDLRNAMMGVFLSATLVLGGIWLVRFRHRPRPLMAILFAALIGGAGFAGGAMWAQNPDNDQHYSGGTLGNALEYQEEKTELAGTVAVQVDDKADEVQLLLPPPRHHGRPQIVIGPPATPNPPSK